MVITSGVSSYADQIESQKVDKLKNDDYLKNRLKYTEEQIKGEAFVTNKNGNIYKIVDYKLVPAKIKESKSSKNSPEELNNILEEMMLKQESSKKEEEIPMENMEKNSLDVSLDAFETFSFVREDQLQGLDKEKSKDHLMESDIKSKAPVERIDKRGLYSKNYELADGSTMLEVASAPIHYMDGDLYKDINLEIKEDDYEGFDVALTENTFRTYFNKYDSIDDHKFIRYEAENKSGKTRYIEFSIPDGTPTGQTIDGSNIRYHNVYSNVDIEYTIGVNKFKENIYIANPVESYDIKMLMSFDGLEAVVQNDGTIGLVDSETDEVLWNIQKPYAEDSALEQRITYGLHYEIKDVTFEGRVYKELKLVFEDKEFLDNATFPIMIDPTIFASTNTYGMINSASPSSFWGSNTHSTLLFGSPNGSYDTYVDYLNFDLSQAPSNASFSTALLYIQTASMMGNNVVSTYTAKRLTSNFWNKSWNNRPTVTNQNSVSLSRGPMDVKNFQLQDMLNDAWRSNFYGFEVSGTPSAGTGFTVSSSNPIKLYTSYKILRPVTITRYVGPANGSKIVNKTRVPFQVQIDSNSDSVSKKMFVKPQGGSEYEIAAADNSTNSAIFYLDYTVLPDGPFSVRFDVTDGLTSDTKTLNYYLDNNGPQINQFDLNVTDSTISIVADAVDLGYTSSSIQYKYTLDGVVGNYGYAKSKVYNGLAAATEYAVKLDVKDLSELVTTQTKTISTLANKPVFTGGNLMPESFDITFTEGNGSAAEYQIKIGEKFINQSGEETTTATWIKLTDHKININGLTGDTEYSVIAKARNTQDIETDVSSPVLVKTSANAPDKVVGVKFSIVDSKLVIDWDNVNNITAYDVLINNAEYSTITNKYTLESTAATQKYTVKVRGVNGATKGEWSDEKSIVPSNSVDISLKNNKVSTVVINVVNVSSFTDNTYKIRYDSTSMTLLDACGFTMEKEDSVQLIGDMGINLKTISDGLIEFSITEVVPDGSVFTGPINIIKFMGKNNTTTNITLEVE